VLIDGFAPVADSLLPDGAWWPRPYARAKLILRPIANGVELVHDGTGRSSAARRHSRTLKIESATLDVHDAFIGEGEVTLHLCWTLGESFHEFDANTLCAHGLRGTAQFTLEGVPNEMLVIPAGEKWRGGWWSPEYGVAEPCISFAIECRVRLPAEIRTRVVFDPCAV
jgi:hypothetical protein